MLKISDSRILVLWSLFISCCFATSLTLMAGAAGLRATPVAKRTNDELNRQEFVQYQDGTRDLVLYEFGQMVDSAGKEIEQRVDLYTVRFDKAGKILQVTDEHGIDYAGPRLEVKDDEASFIDQRQNRVTIRKDGSRMVQRDQGKGGGYETDEGGRLVRLFGPDGNNSHVYDYKIGTKVIAQDLLNTKTVKSAYLYEFVTTNTKGEKMHWKLASNPDQPGKQTWLLQNHASGKKLPMPNVERIDLDRQNSIVIISSKIDDARKSETKPASVCPQ